jgi:SAM-dependent methyltransferase
METLLRTSERNRYFRKLASFLGFGYSSPVDPKSPRSIEYPWVLTNLGKNRGHILDVGSTGSTFPVILASLGYQVHSIDFRQYALKVPNRLKLKLLVGDVRQMSLPNEAFDVVTAISTLEHIGLGRYGDPVDSAGDRKAVSEIMRVLKKKGKLLMTVPFGRRHTSLLHRVYDEERLDSLLNGFVPERIEFFGLKDGCWVPTWANEVRNVDSSKSERAIGCLVVAKQ